MTDPFPLPPALTPAPPALPEKWRGIALLTPYRDGEVFAAEVQYDWSSASMLVTMWGLEGSARQRLFVGDQFFILEPPGEKGARKYGPFPSTTAVPPPDWLKSRCMSCMGSGVVMGADCDWWVGYSANTNGYQNPPPPGPAQVCNWAWLHKDTGYPFRLFFTNADNPYRLPEPGDFSMTIFTSFQAEKELSLAPLVAEVRAQATPLDGPGGVAIRAASTAEALQTAIADLFPGPQVVDPVGMAGKLIKGLEPAPKDAPLPEWPDHLCITGYTYPTAKTLNIPPVLPLRVFYDWPNGRMLTRCALAVYGFDGVPVQDLILNTSITPIIVRNPDGSHICARTVPGRVPKRHWAKDAAGQPKAVIRDIPKASNRHRCKSDAIPPPCGTMNAGKALASMPRGAVKAMGAEAGQRVLDSFDAEVCFQRDRHPPRQDPAREPVQHGSKAEEAACHRDVGDVHHPTGLGRVMGNLRSSQG